MLTNSDTQVISNIIKTELKPVKDDLKVIKKDLKDLTNFVKDSIPPIFEWTDDIHKSIVKEKLLERVKDLERTLKTS
ncbi:hypothetical protein HYT02_01895 [Candidatus Gottesmanbacteria bacterium]|nr:hypothetical protein [Candidatus Gottesmanbacteria bacterium]